MGLNLSKDVDDDIYVKMVDNAGNKINFGEKDHLINDSGRQNFISVYRTMIQNNSLKNDDVFLFIFGNYIAKFPNYNSAIQYSNQKGYNSSQFFIIKPNEIKYS